ncbi:serpin family protein [Echinicola sediminis]
MKYSLLFFLALFVGSLSSCVDEKPKDEQIIPNLRTLQDYEKDLASSSSAFAIDLYQQLSKSEQPNLFFSPYSIQQALSMAMNGNKGEVLHEYLHLLNFENTSLEEANRANHELTQFLKEVDPKVKLNIANGIWYKKSLSVKAAFQHTMQSQYLAALSQLDMKSTGAADIINKWIEDQTENLIKDMLDQVDTDAVMYLVNAIYFKGNWKFQFDKNQTKKETFHINASQSTLVDMMGIDQAAGFLTFKDEGLTYIEIPYSTGQYSMGILLPDHYGLEQIESQLTLAQLAQYRENARERNIILKMPKFKMRQKINNMKDDLKAMGLVTPFEFDEKNFTELFDTPTDLLKISRVIHDALIEVDETGTAAAAATVVEIVELTSAIPGPTSITIDRPFVFFIQEKHSGAILFMGKLTDPSQL